MPKTATIGQLTFFCGKMGAGKSHEALARASNLNAVLISEDDWLAAHFQDAISSFQDYLKFSALIRPFVRGHVQNILKTGTGVVMDFPGNTRAQRKWLKDTAFEIGAPHNLVYIRADDALCLHQIAKRREEHPERAAFDTEDMFRKVTAFFEEPGIEEGLNVEVREK